MKSSLVKTDGSYTSVDCVENVIRVAVKLQWFIVPDVVFSSHAHVLLCTCCFVRVVLLKGCHNIRHVSVLQCVMCLI